jgi:hypothetical protein
MNEEVSMAETDAKKTCGIIMPISELAGCPKAHWDEVRGIIEQAIRSAGFEPNMVSHADEVA